MDRARALLRLDSGVRLDPTTSITKRPMPLRAVFTASPIAPSNTSTASAPVLWRSRNDREETLPTSSSPLITSRIAG